MVADYFVKVNELDLSFKIEMLCASTLTFVVNYSS